MGSNSFTKSLVAKWLFSLDPKDYQDVITRSVDVRYFLSISHLNFCKSFFKQVKSVANDDLNMVVEDYLKSVKCLK